MGESWAPREQQMRDSPSQSLPDTPEPPTYNEKGAASAMLAPEAVLKSYGLRVERRGRKGNAPQKTLTPISHRMPHSFYQPQGWWGQGVRAVAALQAVIHQARRLAQVFLIRAPSGLLHPGGCLQEGLMRNCLQMLSCKQDVKKGG